MIASVKNRILTVFVSVCVLLCFGFLFVACDKTPDTQNSMHKITFLSGQGDDAKVLGVVYSNGKEEIELPEIPVRQGYEPADSRFVFYQVDEQGNTLDGEYNFEKDTFLNTELTRDLNVYALYVPSQFRIHYIIEGEDVSEDVAPQDAKTINDQQTPSLDAIWYYVSDTDIALPTPTIAGHRFIAWYFTEAFDQKIDCLKAGSTGDIILYARFVAE